MTKTLTVDKPVYHCKDCGGTVFTKDGTVKCGKGKRQRYECKNCSTTTVKARGYNLIIDEHKKQRIDKLTELKNQGHNYRQIAQILNEPYPKIYKYCKRHNI